MGYWWIVLYLWVIDELSSIFELLMNYPLSLSYWWIILYLWVIDELSSIFELLMNCPLSLSYWWIILYLWAIDELSSIFELLMNYPLSLRCTGKRSIYWFKPTAVTSSWNTWSRTSSKCKFDWEQLSLVSNVFFFCLFWSFPRCNGIIWVDMRVEDSYTHGYSVVSVKRGSLSSVRDNYKWYCHCCKWRKSDK